MIYIDEAQEALLKGTRVKGIPIISATAALQYLLSGHMVARCCLDGYDLFSMQNGKIMYWSDSCTWKDTNHSTESFIISFRSKPFFLVTKWSYNHLTKNMRNNTISSHIRAGAFF
jgi:hypothetical protein